MPYAVTQSASDAQMHFLSLHFNGLTQSASFAHEVVAGLLEHWFVAVSQVLKMDPA